MTVAMK